MSTTFTWDRGNYEKQEPPEHSPLRSSIKKKAASIGSFYVNVRQKKPGQSRPGFFVMTLDLSLLQQNHPFRVNELSSLQTIEVNPARSV